MKQYDFKYKTPKIEFNMHYTHKLISYEELKNFEVSKEEKIHACTHGLTCANYNNCFSCPPISPNLDRYNKENYKKCLVYSFWVDWDFVIGSDNPYFHLVNANRTISPYGWKYAMVLEKKLGGKVMIDGRCPICRVCEKKKGKPCAYPKERRSSLEAVGINATELCEKVLEHKIQWYRKENDKIIEPEYLTIVHGLLTNIEVEPETIISMETNKSLW